MFAECSGLRSLDVSSFNTSKVHDMVSMFNSCTALTTIYARQGWSTESEYLYDDNMFLNCYSLVGENGTAYDASHTDLTYARIDGGPQAPGYFTSIDGMATGIVSAEARPGRRSAPAFYDLSGRRLSAPAHLTVVNGRKVIKK